MGRRGAGCAQNAANMTNRMVTIGAYYLTAGAHRNSEDRPDRRMNTTPHSRGGYRHHKRNHYLITQYVVEYGNFLPLGGRCETHIPTETCTAATLTKCNTSSIDTSYQAHAYAALFPSLVVQDPWYIAPSSFARAGCPCLKSAIKNASAVATDNDAIRLNTLRKGSNISCVRPA